MRFQFVRELQKTTDFEQILSILRTTMQMPKRFLDPRTFKAHFYRTICNTIIYEISSLTNTYIFKMDLFLFHLNIPSLYYLQLTYLCTSKSPVQ
jgi:hypothetical protein